MRVARCILHLVAASWTSLCVCVRASLPALPCKLLLSRQSVLPYCRNRSVNFTRTNLPEPLRILRNSGAPFCSFFDALSFFSAHFSITEPHHVNVLSILKAASSEAYFKKPLHPDLALSLHLRISYLSCKLQSRFGPSRPPPRSHHHEPRTGFDAESFGLSETRRLVSFRIAASVGP